MLIRNILLLIPMLFLSLQTQAQVSLEQFNEIAKAFLLEFSPDLATQNADLTINKAPSPQLPNFWWDLSETHASYSSYHNPSEPYHHFIFLFGGYARIPGMTPDGVALTLCHELGHGVGGPPYKDKENIASTEGQSDYYAARHCLKRMFKHIPEFQAITAPTPFTANLCHRQFSTPEAIYDCYRGFQALEVERLFFRAYIINPRETYYETPDQRMAEEMDLSPSFYPDPQCRLDTMIAGILEQERPRCWFVP